MAYRKTEPSRKTAPVRALPYFYRPLLLTADRLLDYAPGGHAIMCLKAPPQTNQQIETGFKFFRFLLLAQH